jgi:hypothetical protein
MMLYQATHRQAVRLLLLVAVLATLSGMPTTPSVFAGDCATSTSGNCTG